MCAWNTNSPDGTKSVKDNNAIIQANTTYTETTQNIDHFWNIGADEDGHHQYAQMPKYVDGAVATPTSPTLDAGMDLAYFARLKTALESVAQQDVQPYARNASAIMQILGIRACGVFNVSAGGVITTVYNHNVRVVERVPAAAVGRFALQFQDALPSADYAVLAMGSRRTTGTQTNQMVVSVSSSDATINVKNTSTVRINCTDLSGSLIDPLQCYFLVFGG